MVHSHTVPKVGVPILPSPTHTYTHPSPPVFEPESWENNLPHTISAVFYPSYARGDQQAHARQIHASFLRRYRLTEEVVPLLKYDPEAGRHSGKPFSLADS